jgi:hypothetical protein
MASLFSGSRRTQPRLTLEDLNGRINTRRQESENFRDALHKTNRSVEDNIERVKNNKRDMENLKKKLKDVWSCGTPDGEFSRDAMCAAVTAGGGRKKRRRKSRKKKRKTKRKKRKRKRKTKRKRKRRR